MIIIHTSPNISRSKGYQIMELGQSIERNMRNVFLEKTCRKCGRETSPRPFSKKSKMSISLNQQFENLYSLFLLYDQAEAYQSILN